MKRAPNKKWGSCTLRYSKKIYKKISIYFFLKKLKAFFTKKSNTLSNEKMSLFKAFLKRTGLEEKAFQCECFQWCLYREQTRPQEMSPLIPSIEGKTYPAMGIKGGFAPLGGILALEMGLGKTIIMLALMECNFKYHTLIVVPLSLLNQWEKIIQKQFGHQPLVYHGTKPKNMQLSLEEIKGKPIVLTTYGQVAMPSEKQLENGKKLSLLHSIQWDRIICDEGHHVSHKKTNEYKGVAALKKQICWLVTGTPIQNNEKELYNLFGLLGLNSGSVYYKEEANYTETVKKYVYYKTKTEANIILPPLQEHLIAVQWENESEKHFSSHIHSMLPFCNVPRESLAEEIADKEDPRALRMKYLSKARQVCLHPPILQQTIKHFEMLYKRQTSTAGTSAAGTSASASTSINFAELYVSESKINALVKTLLERKDNGCGKIVFCHYYAEIDIIAKRLLEKYGDKKKVIVKFDGRVPHSQRHKLLSEPADVLLAQIKMCREGLNLQDNYSEVYFTSPDFNPTMEDQAIARCWRMGQTKQVNVFRYAMTSEAVPSVATAYNLDSYSIKLQNKKREIIAKMAKVQT